MTFPSEFARHDLRSLQAAEQTAAANAIGLPHFAACLESIQRCQAAEPGGTVRSYLRDLLHQGRFRVCSPLTGRELWSGSSLLLVDKSVLFSFPDEPDFLLGIGDISLGYPICALIITSPALLLPVVESLWGFAERHLPLAAAAIQETGWAPAPISGPLTLVVGDTNFAHHAWNQLSALHELAQQYLPGNVHLLATQQPLGPIRELLPELPPWQVTVLPDTALQAQNRPGAVFAPVGGQFISAALSTRILDFAIENMSSRAKEIDQALTAIERPVLWMSVRTRNRTATNQHALLLTLGRCFLHAAPTGAVIIDGYSLSDDLATYPAYHRDEAKTVLAADWHAVAALCEALDQDHPGQTYAAVGLTVSDSIALARHASVYLCHHGTVQHKIGWFNATPGVVHCNRAMLTAAPARWVAAQSEVALPPTYIHPDLVQDSAETSGADAQFAHLLRHENYTILDIPAVVTVVLGQAEAAGLLTLPSQECILSISRNMPADSIQESGNTTKTMTQYQKQHLLPVPDSLVATGILYTDFFRYINDNLHPRTYFEIGTHLGRSVKEFTCDAVCVDPHFMLDQDVLSGRGQTHFYQMPSDQFFAEHDLHQIFKNGPDICFLDGMHRSEYLLRDFINTERKCHKRSVIFMHDCLPVNSRMTLRTHVAGDPSEGYWQHAWTGDVWKVVPLLQARRPDLQMFCLDCAPTGLIAISNLDPSSTALSDVYTDLISDLRDFDLEEHTIRKLWESVPVIDTRSLFASPEDLTLFLNIY